MEVTLEGSNSAETLPPWDGVTRLHRLVTGKPAVGLGHCFFVFGLVVVVDVLGSSPRFPFSFFSSCLTPLLLFSYPAINTSLFYSIVL